jgi:SAM-dependent methyltransferase
MAHATIPIIYLRQHLHTACSTQPPDVPTRGRLGRADLYHRCTWAYNPLGLPARYIPISRRALLPHVFTLTSVVIQRRLFSVALSRLHLSVQCPDVIRMRCSVLSGLSSLNLVESDRAAYNLSVKLYVYILGQNEKTFTLRFVEITTSNVDMSLRWRIAQWCEWRWWRRYLAPKDKATYIAWKRTYWLDLLARIADVLPIQPTDTIADIGCGPAGIYLALDQQPVTAVDPLLELYRDKLPFFNPLDYPHARFVSSSLECYSPSETYDVIFCMNAINHVSDIALAYDRLIACAHSGSYIVMTVDAHRYPLLKRLFRLIPGDILHPHQYDLAEYEAMLTSRGCTVLRSLWHRPENVFDHYILVARVDISMVI